MLSLLACVLLVVMLGLAVLASMLVENWGRWTVSLPTGVLATEPHLPVTADGDVDLVIDGRSAADRAVAVLLGAYAADRYPEANRAAAWVTAADGPPGRLGESYPVGVDLRARPVAVGRLLDCADQGRCWLALSSGTDVGRGLRARPPSCPVLRGCAVIWQGTRAAMTRLDPEDVGLANAAVAELGPRWGNTTGAADVAPLADALDRAAAAGVGLVIRVALGTVGPAAAPEDLPGDLAPASDHVVERRMALSD